MNTEELLKTFRRNHKELVDYIDELPQDLYSYKAPGKWDAGQQLEHIRLCLLPLERAVASKDFLREKFGWSNRKGMTYEEVLLKYEEALKAGGKAPERFVPDEVSFDRKQELIIEIMRLTDSICKILAAYTDEELDGLQLPHPLLGSVSVREMFYIMTHHAAHHRYQTQRNIGISAS